MRKKMKKQIAFFALLPVILLFLESCGSTKIIIEAYCTRLTSLRDGFSCDWLLAALAVYLALSHARFSV